jgi:hypothetical protein
VAPHLGSRIALLQETLTSHRAACALNRNNLDIHFNTGQVLSSLAETLLGSETEAKEDVSARALLEEAADLLGNCLAAQQREYEQIALQWKTLQLEESDSIPDDADITLG